MRTKRMIYLVSGAACLLLAVGLILYPILGNALAEKNKSLVMTEYSRAVEEMTDTRVARYLPQRRRTTLLCPQYPFPRTARFL